MRRPYIVTYPVGVLKITQTDGFLIDIDVEINTLRPAKEKG